MYRGLEKDDSAWDVASALSRRGLAFAFHATPSRPGWAETAAALGPSLI